MAAQELTFKITATDAGLKAVMASARQEIAQTAQSQKAVSQSELSMRQQLSAAASLQRQRSAALIADWKKQEAAAKSLASSTRPVGENLQTITNIMTQLGASVGVLQGPLNGLSGRITSLGTLARTTSSDLGAMGGSAAEAGGSVAAIAGPIGIAVIAVGAMAAGSFILTQQLFELAKAAADFRGKMFDLSQQTGVSVEMLSTLEILATTTGGSIESVAQSLVIFQGHLDDAQDSGSKMGKMFADLGISTRNTEDAFRDAVTAIAKMPVGFEQTNTAAELFGRRGGKQVLAIIKEMDGDLPGVTAKLREMGLVISTEDARAADEFNDQLAILQFQMRALLGKEVIPAALDAMRDASKLLKENKDALDLVGSAVGAVAYLMGSGFKVALHDIANQLGIVNILLDLQGSLFERLARKMSLIAPVDLSGATAGVGGNAPPEVGISVTAGLPRKRGSGGAGGASGGKTAAQREAEIALRELQAQEDVNNALIDAYNRLQDELAGVNTATRAYAVEQEILNGKLKDATPLLQAEARANAKLADNAEKQLKLQNQLHEFLERQQANIKLLTEGEANYITQTDDFIRALEKEGAVLQERTKSIMRGSAVTLQLAEDNEKLIKSLQDLASLPPPPVLAGLNEDEAAQAAGAAANAAAGLPPPVPIEVIDSWTILKEASMDALNSMAQGVGSLVNQWVLYGSVGPNAIRKMLAAILAAAAAQAAVEAIMQLAHAAKEFALGLAAASNPFTAAMAPAHFAAASAHVTAAGIYGAVAGVAAVSGRAIAGGAFNESTGGRAGGSSGGGSSGSSTPRTIEADRRSGSNATIIQPIVNVTIKGEATEGFKYIVEKALTESLRENGVMRKIQNGEFV